MWNYLKSWYVRDRFDRTHKQLEYALEHNRYLSRLEAELQRVQSLRYLRIPIRTTHCKKLDEASNP